MPERTFPETFLQEICGRDPVQDTVFDPALKQFDRAFRMGAPSVELSTEQRKQWFSSHQEMTDSVLQTLVGSTLGPGLVLRGSWLLSMWFGSTARSPNDLDFVETSGLTPEEFVSKAKAALGSNDALVRSALLLDEIKTSEIWAYERTHGRRLVIPWAVGDLNGVVQVDVTFGEEVPCAIEVFSPESNVLVVTKELSLAWKLKWLLSDSYPQGKDLFDAVLLSRHVQLGEAIETWLRDSFAEEITMYDGRVHNEPRFAGSLDSFDVVEKEWQWFAREYPEHAAGHSAESMKRELSRNLNMG